MRRYHRSVSVMETKIREVSIVKLSARKGSTYQHWRDFDCLSDLIFNN